MHKPRRYSRVTWLVDIAVQPAEEHPTRFAARMFNASKSGAALFSKYYFDPGKLVAMELILPVAGQGMRRLKLYGVVRHVEVQATGNILGVEFVTDKDAGDYEWFVTHMDEWNASAEPAQERGFTLVEVCIAMIVICLLVTMSIPFYTRAIEQARGDAASAKLKTIWAAQRVYWLEHRVFTTSFGDLESMDLVDPSLRKSTESSNDAFVYQITSASDEAFTARALRNSSGIWTGQFEIDESGEVTGLINGPDGYKVISPPP